MNELELSRLTESPEQYVVALREVVRTGDPEMVANTRNDLVDIDGLLKRRGRDFLLAGRRSARVTEWEMAHRWPPNADGVNRTDDRPPIDASMGGNIEAWQRVYAVGRVDIDWLLTEPNERELSQAKVIARVERATPRQFPEALNVRIGDFEEVLDDVDDAALILTDPPYGRDHVELYRRLGKFAAERLRPGGSLIAYSGQDTMHDCVEALGESLRYWWTLALLHHSGPQQLPGKWIQVRWKPLLWFVNDHRDGRSYIDDVVHGTPPRKHEHEWAQGLEEVTPLIQGLTARGDLIVDPFAGSGTTGLAALALGRRFVGAEVAP